MALNSLIKRLESRLTRTPFFYGWLILGIASMTTFAGSGVTQVVLGGIQVYITEDTGWTKNTISFAASAGTWSSGPLTLLIGRLADRYGPRWLMPVGLVVTGICFLSLSGVTSVWQFYLSYVLARAVSQSVLIGLVPRTAAVNFFRRRRNLALAIVSTFRPITGAINIQIISIVATRQDWRAAYRYLGIFSLLLVVPAILFMRRRPEDIGLLPDGAPPEGPTGAGRGRAAPPEDSWTAGEALKTRTYWLIVVTAILGTLAASSTGFSLVPYLVEDVGLSTGSATVILSLGTVLSLSNVWWGWLSDVITPRRCVMVTLLGTAGMLVYLTYLDSIGTMLGAVAFALVWGVFSGAVGTLENMVLAQYYGRASFGAILGAFAPFQTAALGLGPALASMLREATGNYTTLYIAMVGAYLLSAVLMFLARPPVRPEPPVSGTLAAAR